MRPNTTTFAHTRPRGFGCTNNGWTHTFRANLGLPRNCLAVHEIAQPHIIVVAQQLSALDVQALFVVSHEKFVSAHECVWKSGIIVWTLTKFYGRSCAICVCPRIDCAPPRYAYGLTRILSGRSQAICGRSGVICASPTLRTWSAKHTSNFTHFWATTRCYGRPQCTNGLTRLWLEVRNLSWTPRKNVESHPFCLGVHESQWQPTQHVVGAYVARVHSHTSEPVDGWARMCTHAMRYGCIWAYTRTCASARNICGRVLCTPTHVRKRQNPHPKGVRTELCPTL